ncbi:MAG: cell division protein FtsA [Polyangiales bacterium]
MDIGTTKTVAVVGEVGADGVDVTGVGEARSKGLRKGVVVNIESTVGSIREAIERASNMAGVQIATVFAGVAGSHVRGLNSHGIVTISNHEVSGDDVSRVLDLARQIQIPLDRQVIHVLPQDYVVDQQDGVREPVGMSGVRLEAKVHLVTAAVTSLQNVSKCVERCGLRVEELVLEPSRAPRPCSPTTRRRSASPSSTSAAAPPTWWSTSTARWCTPRSSPSAG